MTHQESRAERQPGGGMAAVERDVRNLSPDQQALGLVEAIQREAVITGAEDWVELVRKLGAIMGHAVEVKVLLDERDAAAEKLVALVQIAVWRAEGDERDKGVFPDNKERYARELQSSLGHTWLLQATTALARVKGAS